MRRKHMSADLMGKLMIDSALHAIFTLTCCDKNAGALLSITSPVLGALTLVDHERVTDEEC